jgi:hypothetical protein
MSLQSLLLIGAANASVVVKIAGDDAIIRIRITAIAVAVTLRPPFPTTMFDIWESENKHFTT